MIRFLYTLKNLDPGAIVCTEISCWGDGEHDGYTQLGLCLEIHIFPSGVPMVVLDFQVMELVV